MTGRTCNVKASHRDREDDHGFVARKFEREFSLPKNVDVDTVKSIISSDGVLTFKAARTGEEVHVHMMHRRLKNLTGYLLITIL